MPELVITPGHPLARTEPFLAWLREHAVDPDCTYEVRINGGEMTVLQFDRNDEGRFYVDPETKGAVMRDPFTIAIERPLPDVTSCEPVTES